MEITINGRIRKARWYEALIATLMVPFLILLVISFLILIFFSVSAFFIFLIPVIILLSILGFLTGGRK